MSEYAGKYDRRLLKICRELEAKLALYQSGYKGACYACEPVGKLNHKLRALLKESRDDLVHYIDQDHLYRHEYPHITSKWDNDMSVVRRIDEALDGEEER